MQTPTGSSPKVAKGTILSDLLIDQIKSRSDLIKALPTGGFDLSIVRQQRNTRAKAIRGFFKVLKGDKT